MTKINIPPKTEVNMTHRAELDNPDSWAIRLLNSSVTFTARYRPIGLVAYSSKSRDLAGPGRTKPLWLSGDVIGYNNLSLWVDNRLNDTRITTPVFVIMNNPFWNKFCTLVMVVMVLLNSINMGAQLDMGIIVKVFKTSDRCTKAKTNMTKASKTRTTKTSPRCSRSPSVPSLALSPSSFSCLSSPSLSDGSSLTTTSSGAFSSIKSRWSV